MPSSKALILSGLGALVGAAVWVALIKLTGWNLWLLAPIVGGAAGYGMMNATQMKGGLPAGVAAAVCTLVAIFAGRYLVVSTAVQEFTSVSASDAVDLLAQDVAEEWTRRGIEAYDENEDDLLPEVYAKAQARWQAMSAFEQDEYLAAFRPESEQAAAFLTPIALLFDFGIFGTIFAALAAGTAYRTGSITLEQALEQEGHAADPLAAAQVAAKLRSDDDAIEPVSTGASFWTRPLPPDEEGPNLRPAQQKDITPDAKLHREAA